MPIEHQSRTGKTYYLHVVPGKAGKAPRYYFSTALEGTLADAIPPGYETYEDIRGMVFLRRKTPALITDEELQLVNKALALKPKGKFYQAEVKKKAIVIYEAEDRTNVLREIALPWISLSRLQQGALESASFQAVMRFTLVDAKKRTFSVERFCFRGSVDDWIPISFQAAPLAAHIKEYVKHLGQDSLFELF